MSLLSIGTVAFDTIRTPYGVAEMVIGGACTYISWAASYFTQDIHIVAVIGEDFPTHELETLRKRGVNLDGLEIRKGEKSFFWEGRYHENMNSRDTLVTDLNVLANFSPVVPEKARSSRYVMLGNLTPAIQLSVLDQLDGSQELIAMDTMNFWMDTAMTDLKKVLKRVNVLTLNDEEARQLSGEHSLVKAASAIKGMGPEILVIKKGEHGALLFTQDDLFYAPALPLADVYDPTGAGDTFAGGFMGYIARTDDYSPSGLKRAVIAGSAMASFCVEAFSIDRLRTLSDIDIQQRMQQFKNLIHFEL